MYILRMAVIVNVNVNVDQMFPKQALRHHEIRRLAIQAHAVCPVDGKGAPSHPPPWGRSTGSAVFPPWGDKRGASIRGGRWYPQLERRLQRPHVRSSTGRMVTVSM